MSIHSLESHGLLLAHQELHEGIILPHVTGHTAIAKNNDSFVDDTDQSASILADTFYHSERATIKHLEIGAQFWADLIKASGGAIAYHKSLWQILTFNDFVFPPTIKDLSTSTITLHDNMGAHTEIRQISSSQPNKGLGVRQTATADQTPEYDFQLTQCRTIAAPKQHHQP